MSQNISGYHLPGIAPNISFIETQCTPALCNVTMYGTVTYVPTLWGNLIYLALFALFLFVQLIFVCIYRTWSYSFAMSAGLFLEVIGYYGRIAMHYNVFNTNNFLVNIIALTIAPVFFTAAIYLTLARVIVHYGVHNSRLSPKAYSITFMTSDLIALILQSVGGGIADQASTKEGRNNGVHIMVGGLSFQIISLTLFISLAAEFFLKVKKDRARMRSTNWAAGQGPPTSPKGYKTFVWAFAFATFFILIRSAYRVAELAHGFSSKLANDQTTFMIFESAMMAFALCIMTSYHPGRYIGRDGWKVSGWGKKSKVLEAQKQPSPAMGNGDWTARYGNGQPANKAYAQNERDIYMPVELNPYHSQVHHARGPEGEAEARVRLMDRVG